MHARLFCLAVICGILALSAPAGAVNYTVTDLGTLKGDTESYAYGVNNTGQVVGYSDSSSGIRAFLYDNGTMTDLGVLAGGTYSVALGINDAGQVVGYSRSSSGYRAFLYENGAMTDLDVLPEGTESSAYGINNAGQVVGYSESSSGDRAFLYDNGAMTDLCTLEGGDYSYAYGINDAGQVVGESDSSLGERAFFYENGAMTDLGVIPEDTESCAYGINNAGQVVGYSRSSSGYRAFLYKNGAMTDLGVLPEDTESSAWGINNAGQVVGYSRSSSGYRAFLYENGAMTDLNSLLAASSFTGTIVNARDINDTGQIVGYATIRGQNHAVLLSPVPSPPTDAKGTIGSRITMAGPGFGTKKGSVKIGGKTCKIVGEWKNDSITCEIKAALPPESYDIVVKLKEPKGVQPITYEGALTMMAPEITSVDPASGSTPDEIVISGNYFGTKKGKVYLEYEQGGKLKKKTCKVKSWGMDGITFIAPKTSKSFLSGSYPLKVTNKVGTAETPSDFTID